MKPHFVSLLAASLVLAGCTSSAPPSGQVLARVNDREITLHQLNQRVAQGNGLAQAAALEQLVRRELAVEQALSMQLERQPEVMLKLEEARRDALAAAWASHVSGSPALTEDGAAARFYAAHPGLFAERRLYRLLTISLPADEALAEALQTRLKPGQGLSEIRHWLKENGTRHSEKEIVRLAEQLPIEVADRLWRLPTGQAMAFRSPEALSLYLVRSADALPLSWAEAEANIRKHLAEQAQAAQLEKAMQALRSKARIEYASAS
ncbi:MAG: EpsD family peptidyl-prolyl cis-trans isomerase [Rhodocyclales bacterium]|nr:EpsD family peptidyl-prolyl cis-trans isomerase [Rhodocyclales bacterium]